jgi:hypothetical protein
MNLVPLPTSITQGGRAIMVDASVYEQVLATSKLFPGARVSSGYRTAAENAAVDGAPGSDHLLGLAVDWVSASGKGLLSRLWSWATQQGFPYVEPLGQSGDHVHISYARAGTDTSAGPSSSGTAGGATDALGCATAIALILSAVVYVVLLPLILHA